MAQTQLYSPEAVENFATAFPRRNDASFAWGNAVSYYLNLPHLRGFWPMSSVNESGNPFDLSGQSRILTNNNAATFGIYGLQSYTALDGVNQFHSRSDEAGLQISENMTTGAWIYQSDILTRSIVTKRGNNLADVSFWLRTNGGLLDFVVVDNVPNSFGISSVSSITVNKWHFCAGRFIAGLESAVFLDNEKTINIVAPIAAIDTAGGHPFNVGAYNNTGELFSGYIALPFLCAAALSDAQIKALYWLTRPLFFGN